MLEFLRGKASERKMRLFAAACCRRIWHLLPDERSRQAIGAVEHFADGSITLHDLEQAHRLAREASQDQHGFDPAIYVSESYPYTILAFQRTAEATAYYHARSFHNPGTAAWRKVREDEANAQIL